MDKARAKALQNFRAKMDKAIAPGACITIDEQEPISVISTGVLTLDAALGVGGLARANQHMIWGAPSAGKTALSLLIASDYMNQNPDAVMAVVDVESSFRKEWLAAFGIDGSRVYIHNAATTEEAVNMYQWSIREAIFDIVLVDSLGAMARDIEVDGADGKGGDAHDAIWGGSAALVSRMVRTGNAELVRLKRRRYAGETDVIMPVCILINQQRVNMNSKFGGMKFNGGECLEHMLATIIHVTASFASGDILYGTDITGKKVKVGSLVKAVVTKNKNAPSPREAAYWFCYQACPEYAFGVSTIHAMVNVAAAYGVIHQAGAWFYVNKGEENEFKSQGQEPMVEYLKQHPDVRKEIRNRVLEIVRKNDLVEIEVTDESA